jgi:hypothetical protein
VDSALGHQEISLVAAESGGADSAPGHQEPEVSLAMWGGSGSRPVPPRGLGLETSSHDSHPAEHYQNHPGSKHNVKKSLSTEELE